MRQKVGKEGQQLRPVLSEDHLDTHTAIRIGGKKLRGRPSADLNLEHVKGIQLDGLVRGTEQIHHDHEVLRVIQEAQCNLQVDAVREEQGKQLLVIRRMESNMRNDSRHDVVPVLNQVSDPQKDLMCQNGKRSPPCCTNRGPH